MATEIERKFLVKSDAWRSAATSSSRFLQAYIAAGNDRSVRVRIMDQKKARLTIKIGKQLIARAEYEYDIPLDDAEELAQSAIGVILEKTRFNVPYEGHIWEVDVYAGRYEGLVVAEVELDDENISPALPDWIGREVTGDRRYSNAVMAENDLSEELLHGLSFEARWPFTQDLRALATRQLEKAIDLLEHQPDGPHAAIHDARKRFKRVRALYRLTGNDARAFRQTENARIGAMAGSLATVRDAAALVETTTYLATHASSLEEVKALANAAEALGRRRDDIAAREHDLSAKLAAAVETCREAIAALATLDLDDRPKKTIRRLRKVWKRERARADAARWLCDPAPGDDASHGHGDREEAFHALRKCGQTYWMHLSLLAAAWPSAMSAKQGQAKALVDLLGHEHDLSVLSQLIDEDPAILGNCDTVARVLGAIITRKQALRIEALSLAAQVFADPPDREAHIIGILWKAAIKGPAR